MDKQNCASKHLFMNSFVFLFTFMLLFLQHRAQTVSYTFERAVSVALENNVEIGKQENFYKINKIEKQQAKANLLPAVSAYGHAYRTAGRQWSNEESALVNNTIDRFEYNITANLTLFNGFSKLSTIKHSNQLFIAQQAQLDQSKQETVLQVSNLYFQILMDVELLNIAQKDVELQQSYYEQIEAFVRTGAKTKSDLVSQNAQLKLSEAQVLAIESKYRLDMANFSKLLKLDTVHEFKLELPDEELNRLLQTSYDPDSLFDLAIDSRPQMKMLTAYEKADKYNITIARSARMPKIDAYYEYGSNYASSNKRLNETSGAFNTIPFEDQLLDENYSHRYGITLSIPIFNRLQTRTSIARAKITHENTILTQSGFESQLLIDIETACHELELLKASFAANEQRVQAAQLAHQKRLELYRLGDESQVALLFGNQQYIQAQFDLIKSKYNLLYQKKIIDFYLGGLL